MTAETPSSSARRRRNRKKKAKSKNTFEAKKEELPKPEETKMNPHARMRNSLLKDGFTADQINKAMEEMWNKNLAYDDYEAVSNYLKSGGEAEKATKETNGQQPKTDAATEATDAEMTEAVEENSPAAAEEKLNEVKTSQEKAVAKPSAPMNMTDKLDMVAGFENLTDAIFAMTEWIIRGAKPHELEELCAAVTTPALPWIIHRSISECHDQSKFDSTVLPGMVRLLDNLLRKCGMPADNSQNNQESFRSILRQARRVSSPGSDGIAERVARFIVSRIFIVLNESKAAKNNDAASLQAEKDSLTRDADQGIAELLNKREVVKIAAKRLCAAARSACHSLPSVNGITNGSSNHSNDAELDKMDILLAIVDEDTKNAFEQHISTYEGLKTQVKEGESEHVTELRVKIEGMQSERNVIANQIEELRRSIAILEARDAEFLAQQENIQADIDAECKNNSEEASRLNSELEEAAKNVQSGDYIRTLVDMLKNFDESLAVRSVQAASQNDSVETNASKMMDLYLLRARTYFIAESNCFQFLQKRIESSQREVAELKLEIAECQGLGMDTTIGQMEETVKAKEDLLVRDTNTLKRVKVEAASMFDAMMERLEEYNTIQEESRNSLSPISAKTMQGIPNCIMQMELPNGDLLDAFLAVNDILSIQPPPPPPVSSDQPSVSAANGNVEGMTEEAVSKPKFTWATGGASAIGTGQKTSLVDIQQEELQTKSRA